MAVAKTNPLKTNLPLGHLQLGRLWLVLHRARPRQGVDAVLHRADVLEQAGHLPHHPMRHALQAQRHGGGRRHGAHADGRHAPQPERGSRHAQNQPHAQRMVDDLKRTHQPHLAVAGVHEFGHGGARKRGFAVRMRKELDGGDVGVSVGDAPGHHRTCIGLLLAHAAQARHKKR